MDGAFSSYRRRVVGIGMIAVAVANAVFAVGRALHGLWMGMPTPWWSNAIGALIIGSIALWYRRAPHARAPVAIHVTAAVATLTLLVPLAYGYASSMWWLTLIAMAMLLMAARRAAWFWVIVEVVLMAGAAYWLARSGANLPAEPWVEVIASRAGFLLVLLAITLSFRQAVRRQARELRATSARLRQSNEVKDRFLRHMGHELRTPLHGIIGLSEQVLSDPSDPGTRRRIESSLGAAQVMLRLVNELLDFGDGDPDRLILEPAPMSLHRCLEGAVETCQAEARQRGLGLSIRIEAGLADARRADEARIRQIALKLLGNALRFTERGSVEVHAGRWLDQADGVCITVSDTGIGIAEELQGRLFKPFEQGHAGSAQRPAGLGLGLAAVRRLARAMGGDVALSSRLGAGTRVVVTLQLARADEGISIHAPTPMPSPDEPAVRSLKLLVCEDDVVCRALLEDCLRHLGHQVCAVEDGADGWAALQTEEFDAVLTDLDMPRMDGRSLVRRIRERDASRHRPALPVVAVSASVAGASQQKAIVREGFDACLRKPFLRGDVGVLLEGLQQRSANAATS